MMIILIIIWFLVGFYSFVYWWTKDRNFTTNIVWFAFLVSFFGPFTFIAGWIIHGERFNKGISKKPSRIIIRKRE